VTLPHGRDELSTRRMAVLYTFREPSLGRQLQRELLRNALLDLTTIMPTTTCHRRSYAEGYSRSTCQAINFATSCRSEKIERLLQGSTALSFASHVS
jgi:hypothetical protein